MTGARRLVRPPGTDRRILFGVVAAAVVVGLLLPLVLNSPKIEFYVDRLDRSGLLHVILVLSAPAFLLALKFPRGAVYGSAFLVPFNVVGGEWGDGLLVSATKVALNLLLATSLCCALLAIPERRAWLTRTPLGVAVLAWLAAVAIDILIGLGGENRADWIRESNWMSFYVFAAAVGTLLHERRDVRRVVWATVAGAAVMQGIAFYRLATGQRYERLDSWSAGATFFRAPFSSAALFVLFLSMAALLIFAVRRELTWRRQAFLLTAFVAFGAGLMAAMGRSLWISAVVGALMVLLLSDWNRRKWRAAVGLGLGAAVSLSVVVAVDRLSPSSTGNWGAHAVEFFLDLRTPDSASTAGRRVEWGNALEVWSHHPLLGAGFGYPFPDVAYNVAPADKFYMHNSYLNVMAKCGLVGMVALACVVAISLGSAIGALKACNLDPFERILLTAVVASLVQMLTLSLFSPVITTTDSIMFFAMLIGLTAAIPRTVRRASNA